MTGKLRIKDLRKTDRPRERLKDQGLNALSDVELIATVMRSGGQGVSALDLAAGLLHKYKTLRNLGNADFEELTQIPHIGIAKAAAIKAAIELGIKAYNEPSITPIKITKPVSVFELLKKDLLGKAKEHVYILSLNARNCVISKDLISIGTLTETLIHPSEVYKVALAKNAVSIVLSHNHPSGDPTPSPEDISITERIAQTGKILGIALLDHIIISNDKFVSLKSLNLLCPASLTKKGGDNHEKTWEKSNHIYC